MIHEWVSFMRNGPLNSKMKLYMYCHRLDSISFQPPIHQVPTPRMNIKIFPSLAMSPSNRIHGRTLPNWPARAVAKTLVPLSRNSAVMKTTNGFWAVAGGGGLFPYVKTDDLTSVKKYIPTAKAMKICRKFQTQLFC